MHDAAYFVPNPLIPLMSSICLAGTMAIELPFYPATWQHKKWPKLRIPHPRRASKLRGRQADLTVHCSTCWLQ